MKKAARRLGAALIAVAGFLSAPAWAGLYDVTGLWYNKIQSGWGVNVIQQDDIVFLTMFVYGPDGKPLWLVGSNTAQVSGKPMQFTGPLYMTTGSYYGVGFDPAATTVRQVGTVTFDTTCTGCNSVSHAQISYSIDGVSYTKALERQTWRAVLIPSSGYGVVKLTNASTCTGYPAGPAMVTFAVSGGTLTLTDTNGVRYAVNLNGMPQYGSVLDGNATPSVSGSPQFVDGSVQLSVESGLTMEGTITGEGAGGCKAIYSFVGSSSF